MDVYVYALDSTAGLCNTHLIGGLDTQWARYEVTSDEDASLLNLRRAGGTSLLCSARTHSRPDVAAPVRETRGYATPKVVLVEWAQVERLRLVQPMLSDAGRVPRVLMSDLDKIRVAAAAAAARIVAGCEHTLIDDGDDWITGAYAGAACEHCVEAALVNLYQGVMRAKAQKTNEDFERERDNVFKYPSDH